MKKFSKVLVFVLAFVTFATLESNGQKSNSVTFMSCVSVEEYVSLSPDEKVLADLYNTSIAGLKAISLNGTSGKYVAIAMFSIKNTKANHVSIGVPDGGTQELAKGGSCKVCGIRQAYACIKKVRQYMADNDMGTITITFASDAVATW